MRKVGIDEEDGNIDVVVEDRRRKVLDVRLCSFQ